MIYPQQLNKGDLITIISPSNGITKPKKINELDKAIQYLEKEGYKVEVYIALYTTILAHIEKIKNSKQVRMIFSDTNSEPELTEEDIEDTIIEDLKKRLK